MKWKICHTKLLRPCRQCIIKCMMHLWIMISCSVQCCSVACIQESYLKYTITDAVIVTRYIAEKNRNENHSCCCFMHERGKQHNLQATARNADNNFMVLFSGYVFAEWRLHENRLNLFKRNAFGLDYLWICVLPLKCNNVLLECLLSNNNGDRLFRHMP